MENGGESAIQRERRVGLKKIFLLEKFYIAVKKINRLKKMPFETSIYNSCKRGLS